MKKILILLILILCSCSIGQKQKVNITLSQPEKNIIEFKNQSCIIDIDKDKYNFIFRINQSENSNYSGIFELFRILIEEKITNCSSIQEQKIKKLCMAFITGDNEYCTESIDDNFCKYFTLVSADSCQSVIDYEERQNCFDTYRFYTAIKKRDIKFCYEIETLEQKYNCLNTINLNYSNEDKYQKEYCSDTFYIINSLDYNDHRYCDKIYDIIRKIDCHDDLFMKSALEKKGVNECLNIKNSTLKEKCVGYVDNEVYKESINKSKMKDCEKILNKTFSNRCKEWIRYKMIPHKYFLDSSSVNCFEFYDIQIRDICLFDLARNSDNNALCDAIFDLDKKNTCYGILLNKSYCLKVRNKKYVEICEEKNI